MMLAVRTSVVIILDAINMFVFVPVKKKKERHKNSVQPSVKSLMAISARPVSLSAIKRHCYINLFKVHVIINVKPNRVELDIAAKKCVCKNNFCKRAFS